MAKNDVDGQLAKKLTCASPLNFSSSIVTYVRGGSGGSWVAGDAWGAWNSCATLFPRGACRTFSSRGEDLAAVQSLWSERLEREPS